MAATGGNMKTESTSTVQEKVTAVDHSGVATIQYTAKDMKMTMNGRSTGAKMPTVTKTLHISPTGKTTGASGSGAGGMLSGMDPSSLTAGTAFPAGPVHVGSHWTDSAPASSPVKYATGSTVEKIYSSGGSTFALLRISTNMDLTGLGKKSGLGMSGSMKCDGTITYNVTTGTMTATHIIANYQMTMSMSMGKGAAPTKMPMSGSYTISMKLQ
jgi:hypothetical protein